MSQTRALKNLRITDTVKSVCPQLAAMITRLVHKYKLTSDEIQYGFHKEFAFELKTEKHGFSSAEELIDCLIRNDYPLEWYYDRDDYRYVRTTRQYFYWLSGIKISQNYRLIDILADISEDVIPCDQQLPDFVLPKDVPMNGCPEILSGDILNDLKYRSVRLMFAISPHEMYLHLNGDDYHYAYHRLRIDMRIYDKKETEDKYRVPSLMLFEGLLCAVRYKKICNEWHRSRLLSIDQKNNCRLLLLDIGDVIETNANELRLLLKKFVELPAQAIKVQLMGVRPKQVNRMGQKGQKDSNCWSNWANNMVIRLEDHQYSGDIECAFVDYRTDRYRVFIKYYNRYKSLSIKDLLFLHQILIDKELAIISSNDEPNQTHI